MIETRPLTVGDHTLATVLTTPASGSTSRLAIMLHGGPGGDKDGPGGLYVDLAELLAGEGIASLRFDFMGAGESSGRYRDMTMAGQVEDLAAVAADAQRQLAPTSLALIGESYGATIAALSLDTADYDCLAMLWPAIWLLDETFAPLVTDDRLREAEQRGFIVVDGAEVGSAFLREVLDRGDVSTSFEGVATPTIFVHGDSDREVPVEQSVRAAGLVVGPHKSVIVPGGEHCLERPHEREVVYREVVGWLAAHL